MEFAFAKEASSDFQSLLCFAPCLQDRVNVSGNLANATGVEQRILSIARSHRRRDAFKLARDRQRMLGPCHVFKNSITLHPPFFANLAKAGPNSSLLLPSRLSLAFFFASSLNSITLIFPSSMILLLPFFLK